MMFEDGFFENLPEDRIEAAIKICEHFEATSSVAGLDGGPGECISPPLSYEDYVDAWAALEAFCEAYHIEYPSLGLTGDTAQDIPSIKLRFNQCRGTFNDVQASQIVPTAREKYRKMFGVTFVYEFTDGDRERVQILVNELREEVTKSTLFNSEHKSRVLKRLEALQAELHKKMASLDKFWALVGEAGVALGKFGKDAKPFVDRIREITRITWVTQARAEELPSDATLPLLTVDKDDE